VPPICPGATLPVSHKRHTRTIAVLTPRPISEAKNATARPRVKIALHQRVGREVLRLLPSLATGGADVKGSHLSPFASRSRGPGALRQAAEGSPSQTSQLRW